MSDALRGTTSIPGPAHTFPAIDRTVRTAGTAVPTPAVTSGPGGPPAPLPQATAVRRDLAAALAALHVAVDEPNL